MSRVIGNGTSRQVLVIGAGVSGLTSALCLVRKGHHVTVVADRLAPRVTSVVAGALGMAARGLRRSSRSGVPQSGKGVVREILRDLHGTGRRPGHGRLLAAGDALFQASDRRRPSRTPKGGRTFGLGASIPARSALSRPTASTPLGLCDAYILLAPMIDTDVYMRWLRTKSGGPAAT